MTKPSASRSVSGQDTSSPSKTAPESSAVTPSEETQPMAFNRQQPIPPPSEPMQFRAIGLVRGKYIPSEERFNRGLLEVDDGTQVDAVLLGQVMSLVKKYIELERPYFWVVYPRTREKDHTLHLQIVGVWSADGFSPIDGSPQSASTVEPDEAQLAQPIEDGYFSVRGQVVYQSNDKQLLYVKIQQAPRKTKSREERGKAFKLRIKGTLPQKAIGYFWDLHVKREGNELTLQSGTSIALMPVQKNLRPQKRPVKPYSKMPNSAKPNLAYRAQNKNISTTRESRPVPKPIKRQSGSSENPS